MTEKKCDIRTLRRRFSVKDDAILITVKNATVSLKKVGKNLFEQ